MRPSSLSRTKATSLIREAIAREFPDDGILGEEGSSKAGTSGRRWIVDPIDGTRDFVCVNRFWCILAALEEAGETLAGAAHFPMLGETYWAILGGGSYRNEDRLKALPRAMESIRSGWC